MDESANIIDTDLEAVRIDAEDTVLALVPSPFVGDEVPIPGSHLAGGEREARGLLGLHQARVRRLEFGSAFGDAALELRIQLSSSRVLRNSSANTLTLARKTSGTTGTGT